MIFYLVTSPIGHMIERFLDQWGRALGGRFQLLTYEDLPQMRQLAAGTYIFSDLERLSATQTEMATRVWDQLAAAGPAVRTLNHPSRALRRHALLRTLHESGINRYKAARATDNGEAFRFPVFVREENPHDRILTPLLRSQDDLDIALVHVVVAGHRLQDLLVVEYCDTSDAAGIHRTYSAFNVGGRILPRNIYFSREWIVKFRSNLAVDDERVREEHVFLRTNPHESWLRKVFSIAGVDYGRIDYGVVGGEPQAWEVETNPAVIHAREDYPLLRLPAQDFFCANLTSAFEAIDRASDTSAREPSAITINLSTLLLRRLEKEPRRQRRAQAFRKVIHAMQESRFVQPLVQRLKPFVDSHAGWFVRIVKAFRTSG